MRGLSFLAPCVFAVGSLGLVGGSVSAAASNPGLDRQSFSTADSEFDHGVFNQGWWADHAPVQNDNDNYVAGRDSGGTEYRDFFSFDLSGVDRRVVSAQLRVNSARTESTGIEQLRLSDVSTAADVVNHNDAVNAEIFEDLGSGSSYGTFGLAPNTDNTLLKLTLNRAAIRDINAAAGGFFSIGGSVLNLTESRSSQYVFAGSHRRPARLVLRLAPGK